METNGIISIQSKHSVDETLAKLVALLKSKGITLFAIVDHSGEAEKVSIPMRPTKLAIFGAPKAGTPVMIAAPSTAIDLPLKILIAEDAEGRTWVSYNDPTYLQARHGFSSTLLPNLEAVRAIAAEIAD